MPSSDAGPSSAREPVRRERVGLWLGLLLLFVPIFYPLLYLRPFSWWARIGWGAWLGLIVFVKVAGLAEPVINLSELEQTVREQEQGTPAPARTAQGTFVTPDDAAPAPALEDYLRELGGGVLGRRIADWQVEGEAIRIRFQPMDWYLDSERAVALESIGAALSLFYGRGFRRVELDFVFRGRPLRVAVTRAAFNDFFAMSAEEVRAVLADRERQARSLFAAGQLPPEQQQAFFERFAEYR